MNDLVLCISASNIIHSNLNSVSKIFCDKIAEILMEKNIECETIDLRDYSLLPCIGCGNCFDSRRCCRDTDFNKIYNKLVKANAVFFISPHYAPIPAKLCMMLEKMEEITFLHWWKDNAYQSEVYGMPAGIISHGGGSDWALNSYKAMVNDTIANALDTIQCKVIPYNDEWNTGISLPVHNVIEKDDIFPVQEYDWSAISQKIEEYVKTVIKAM
ncbi:MAG: flavodoxin family protein [Lachnospiraceae bacterium]|nr:flavodoxin family protein [Lachnospiraceae bacterium]